MKSEKMKRFLRRCEVVSSNFESHYWVYGKAVKLVGKPVDEID